MHTPNEVHIIGCGDIGRRVAQLFLETKTRVNAWVKTTPSVEACQALGLATHRIDFDAHLDTVKFDRSGSILYTVPPPRSGIEDTRLQSFLAHLQPDKLEKFVLISTTGVYGDCAGKWIDESAEIQPKAERAQRRANAEHSLLKWAKKENVDTLILRVPGIYAADRLPIARIKQGIQMVKRNEAPWTNRIHADDLAAACFAALTQAPANEIINISDDQPSTMIDYFNAVADYAGLSGPGEISLAEAAQKMSLGMQSYMAESRRIRNDKMKRLLGLRLRYPTLAEGLAKRP